MSFWNKITGSRPSAPRRPEPWGLYLGATVQFDTLPLRLHPHFHVALPEAEADGRLSLTAQGLIDLGDKCVCRFYTDHHTLLQFLLDGERIEEATLYVAHDAVYPDSPSRLNDWMGERGRMRAREMTLDGTAYHRVWDDPEQAFVTPVRYREDIYIDRNANSADSSIQQTAMLYARPIDEARTLGEYLLVTYEEHRGGENLISLMLGIDIDASVIKII